MMHQSKTRNWARVVGRLGGPEGLDATARETKSFGRPREINILVNLLRLILACCLGDRGLRLTAAWAASVGLVDISNVALLYRLRRCEIAGAAGGSGPAPTASRGRLIRISDATTVPRRATSCAAFTAPSIVCSVSAIAN